jgi:photosynthetic reaction center H subunit
MTMPIEHENPLLSNRGPASYANRADVPDRTYDGEPKIVPLRAAPNFYLEPRDPDPRGYAVIACDGHVAGTVTDVWIDRSEPQLRYIEVAVPGRDGVALVPAAMTKVDTRLRSMKVASITAAQFADVPATRHPERVTLLEEDRIMAYFSAGHLFATPSRMEPLI